MAVIDDNWNYHIDIKSKGCDEFNVRVNGLSHEIINLNGFKAQNYDYNEISARHNEELHELKEENKQLAGEIENKLHEVSKLKSQYENFKQDQELLNQEIKDTFEAFLMAKKYYKKYLKIYYTIESNSNDFQTIFVQFFTEVKKEPGNYSVRLVRNIKTEQYELLATEPKIKIIEDLKKNLQETNDVPTVLCRIRQSFLKIKKSKKP